MLKKAFWRKKNLQPSLEVTADIGSLAPFSLEGQLIISLSHKEKKNALCFPSAPTLGNGGIRTHNSGATTWMMPFHHISFSTYVHYNKILSRWQSVVLIFFA